MFHKFMSLKNRKFVRTVQVIFGLILIVFGSNVFLEFMPVPEFNEAAGAYLGALFATGYIFPIMAILWILVGLLFIFNKCSPLGAVIIFPISLNILLFHIFLDSTGLTFGLIIFILNIYLLYVHWNSYRPMCG